MRVLQLVPQLNYGGVEIGTVDLAHELIRRGHKAYVISAGGKLVPRLIKMGVQHYELPIHKKSLRSIGLIEQVRTIIDKEHIDIVHARSRIPAWIGYFATRRSAAKFITTCHGYYSKHLFSQVMGWGERVIVISRVVGRRMIDDFGVLPERISLIHRGLDLHKYECDKQRYADDRLRKKDKIVIANIGRITPIKGHEYFIKAIHLLTHRFPQVEAWIVGGAGKRKKKYADSLQILTTKLGITKNIKFIGECDNVPKLLKDVDIVVLSTTYPEGFGRVIIEAGASGIAVVSTRVGGVLDIIDEGKGGLLVPAQDEFSMSEALQRIITDSGFAADCAVQLRKKVETQFSLEQMIDKTIGVYEEVIQEKRFLVMKLGAVGDIILVIPSLRMLRKKYPRSYIAVLVDSELTASLEKCPYIDEIITFKRDNKKGQFPRLMRLVKKIRQCSFDICVDFQNNKKTHLIAFLAGIPYRYGYRRGIFGRLLTHGVGSFKDPLPPVQHQFRVLSLMGISEYDERLELWPQKEDFDYINTIFRDAWASNEQKLVGFVLGASKRWITKRWPLEHFISLARKLSQELGVRVVLIGTNNECEMRDAFVSHVDREVLDFVGKTTITQLAALMSKLDCVLCGDTAPLHIASAMKTKIVALFGPTDARRHLPPGPRHIVLRHNLSCSPCYKSECSDGRCMNEINVDEVFEAVKKQLNC